MGEPCIVQSHSAAVRFLCVYARPHSVRLVSAASGSWVAQTLAGTPAQPGFRDGYGKLYVPHMHLCDTHAVMPASLKSALCLCE